MPSNAPQWVVDAPDRIADWLLSVMDGEYFGTFRDCVDAGTPHVFPASGVGLGLLMMTRSLRLEEVPGYSEEALRRVIAHVQGCQCPETGLFIDPCLDDCFPAEQDESARAAFRRAVTGYTIGFLSVLGAKPLHEFSVTGDRGQPDPEAYLEEVTTGDWDKPWAVGSQAGRMTCELFNHLNEGCEEYIPALREGIAFILSKQNPETGMWGSSDIPLFQQISGALKVIGRFQWHIGLHVPYLDRLADSCIQHRADGSFYAGLDEMCIPRNAAEMCMACLEHSDYRRAELLATLASIAEFIHGFQMPDGAFASSRSGTTPIGWCGSLICGRSEKPRSNMNGTQAVAHALGLIGAYLDWSDLPFKNPLDGWREVVAARKYRVDVTSGGKVDIVGK